MPIVFITFVIVFYQAYPIFLLGLLAVYLTVLISNGLAPDSFKNVGVAVFPAFLFAAGLLIFTLIIAPYGDHERTDTLQRFETSLRNLGTRLGFARVRTGMGWPVIFDDRWAWNTDNVGISDAGTRVIHDFDVLEVTTSAPGVFYLRGYSMQYFDGNNWSVNSEAVPATTQDPLARAIPALISHMYAQTFPDSAPNRVHMQISVTGDVTRNIVYTPYFSFPFRFYTSPYDFEFFHVDESILRLYERLAAASYIDSLYDIPSPIVRIAGFDIEAFNAIINSPETYLQIEEEKAASLREFAINAGISADASREVISAQVGDFMQDFGVYTLSPFVIPPDEDFVMYFLNYSRQGFCIHYATAATMMLRALGVPARFTSGFVVIVPPQYVNQPVVITDRFAHAWTEVFFDGIGWLPLEVTPPATGIGLGDGRPGPGGLNPFMPPGIGFDDEPFFPDWWEDDFIFGDFTPGTGLGAQDQAQEQTSVYILRIILIVLLVCMVIAAPFVNRHIALKTRQRQFVMENRNESVICAWRYLSNLHKFRKSEVPADGIEDIAMKAKFSNHDISEEERLSVIKYAEGYALKVYEYNSPSVRLFIRYIRAL
jgi:hypothetical protein